MKRIFVLFCAMVAVFAVIGANQASLRSKMANALGNGETDTPQVDAVPNGLIGSGRIHKVIVRADESNAYETLAARGVIKREIDYGSFKMLIVDEDRGMSASELSSLGAEIRDEQNLIPLNGYIIDTASGKGELNREPADLRQNAMVEGRAAKGLYVVQFVGPLKDEWLKDLRGTGAEIVQYVSGNAYVVRANEKAAASLAEFRRNENVQFVGDYEPAFRITPSLQAARQFAADSDVDITVQIIDGADAKAALSRLQEIATEFVGDSKVLNYRNAQLRVNASRIGEIASMDEVFNVEERFKREKMDEVQGQISAGNLTGNLPSGTGYLTWLAGKGFTSSQFGTFSVNVVDDANTLTGTVAHPDLPSTRVAFAQNPTSQTGAQGGHGFLNSNIVAGFNNGTGAANEDANGYNYGVGIAPWARVGVTAIFGTGASSPTAWENSAYTSSARISSNSWGFQTSTGGPVPTYTTDAQEYDRIVRDAQSGTTGNQQMVVVFAAGNDGSGSNTVSAPGTAKNVITVGASENVRQTGSDGCGIANTGADSANDIISFSSRGPVNSAGGDGRVKPEIVAPGTHIEAGVPQANYDGSSVCNQYFPAGQTLYGWSSGTSHSCPAVAGGAALVRQYFLNNSFGTPSPAMTKAALMNSAAYMSGTGAAGNLPSNSQGMGRMDLGRGFDGAATVRKDQANVLGATGATYTVSGSVVDTGKPFRVTMAFSDAPGATTGNPVVNNLDLTVTVGGNTYRGNVFTGANSVTGGTADAKNNAESVFIPAGVSGAYTVTVTATNIAGDGVPGNADTTDQDFALLVYNGNESVPTNPTIVTSPTSLAFTATVGGANPAAQTVNITNGGAGTLTWTATDNATWLTLGTTSGTAPSSTSASVNIAGLTAGTHTGSITITATGATNSPFTIPVTLTINPANSCTGANLITNGGFETNSTPWTLSGATRNTSAANAHTGSGSLQEGAGNNRSHSAYQTITIPAGCSSNLRFWSKITSNETTTTTQYDRQFIEVRNTAGTLLTTLATFSNLNKGTTYVQRGPYSLAAYAGQTVRIQFRATTDSSLTSTFRVDDVTVQ